MMLGSILRGEVAGGGGGVIDLSLPTSLGKLCRPYSDIVYLDNDYEEFGSGVSLGLSSSAQDCQITHYF